MKSFLLSLVKSILGIFLFGLVLWVNPIDVSADGSGKFNSSVLSGTTPANISSFSTNQTFNVNDDSPLIQYGLVPYSSFKCYISFENIFSGLNAGISFSADFRVYVDLLFSSSQGGAYYKPLGQFVLSFNDQFDAYNFSFDTFCDGIPTGLRVTLGHNDSTRDIYLYSSTFDEFGNVVNHSYSFDHIFKARCLFTDFSFDSSSGGGSSSTIINNTTGNLTPIGYSSLNFGLNGNCYFLGNNRIFQPDYLSPLMFSYDFANSPSGIVSSSPLTFSMGGAGSVSPLTGNPISVIGDTRPGEYELTISLCMTYSPNNRELASLVDPSNWGFEFNRGYSGEQFALPSNTRISYTNFIDNSNGTNYCYTSIYFYFTTPDFFDSFLIRSAPTFYSIRVAAFAFNKYTGTISDQLTQSNQQWAYQNPSHDSFSSANSSAASTVSAFSNIESEAFSNLDTAMSGAGVNDFNINVISTPLATVSAMINQTYNILPDLVKWLILAILVIGIFAVIISANNYVNKD